MGIFLSHSPLAGFYSFLKLLEFSFLGFYIAKNIKTSSFVVFPLAVGLVFECILSISQYLSQGSLGGAFYFFGERMFSAQTPGIANASLGGALFLRPYGTFSHPNVLAGFLLISMTLLLYGRLYGYLKILLLSLGTFVLFLTMSRVAIVCWIILLFFYLAQKSWKVFLIVGFVLFFVFFISPIHLRFEGISFINEAVSDRIILAKVAVEMIKVHLLIGVGLNNFLIELPYFEKQIAAPFLIQPVHNIFLLIFAEAGAIGLGFFVWFLAKTYKRVILSRKIIFIFLLLELLILGSFDHYFLTLQQGQMMMALIFGLSWSRMAGGRSDTIDK